MSECRRHLSRTGLDPRVFTGETEEQRARANKYEKTKTVRLNMSRVDEVFMKVFGIKEENLKFARDKYKFEMILDKLMEYYEAEQARP